MPNPALVELAGRLQLACLAGGLTVATAESCTGGLIAATLTDLPGSSGYVLGGIVSYSDVAKTGLLGVAPALVRSHGAVSAEVAAAMATGARARFGASLAVSVTGIAGPSGGTDAKPVGLTFIGLAGEAGTEVRQVTWAGDRAANRQASVAAAITWLIERVGG